MELVRSNRTEVLADAFAVKVRQQPLSPFQREAIVVQSRGMESWLTLELARRLGIWANPWFPFPRKVIERVLDRLDPESKAPAEAYGRERLKWTIAAFLSDSVPEELRSYLGDTPEIDRLLRFSESVARVFDDYVVYRPDLLAGWVRGRRDGWESELWRKVASRLGPNDLASRMERARRRFGEMKEGPGPGFERLHLFSLETLPPSFLSFFGELSELVPTVLYVLEPSQHYLEDAAPSPQLSLPIGGETRDGHPFVLGAGGLARDFQQLLLAVDEHVTRELALFDEEDRSSLLRSFQSDIRAFEPAPSTDRRRLISRQDQSISVHACTGALREVQVLHDLVRDSLERDGSLRPEDIVVMAPEPETYAPLFRAVFEEGSGQDIPFEVYDRRSRDDTAFYEDFDLALQVLDSRFSVLDLVRLMDARALRDDFRFSPEERARLTDLLAAAGIRWGIDGAHRVEQGFPNDDLHSWRAGLGRLFLGFANMPDSPEPFEGLLPRGAPTLVDIQLVARLSELCEVLFEAQERTRGAFGLARWADELDRLCGALFSQDDETSRATHVLRTVLDELRSAGEQSGFAGALSLHAVRRELARLWVDRTPAVGFLRRGVTLTELVPLRSVPFRIVCVLGMSEDAFPRGDSRPSFDRTRKTHRPGDRNRRHDDRHSFLQALLCARDQLIITYSSPSGSQRIEPNPSPLVWELVETVNLYYRADGDEEPLLRPTVHPLHAFDRRYFRGTTLPRSFSDRYLHVAETLERDSIETPRVELVAKPERAQTVVSIAELTRWLWNPSKAFVDEVLRASFETPEAYEPTNALIEIGRLQAANIGNAAISAGLRGDALAAYLEACPEFPDGSPGAIRRRSLRREIEAVLSRSAELRKGEEGVAELVRVDLGETVVEGRLRGLCGDVRVFERFSRVGRKAELVGWTEHLLMLAGAANRGPDRTHVVLRGTEFKSSVVSYGPVELPRELLARLVSIYETCRTRPIPLLEGASRKLVENRTKGPERARGAARKALAKQRQWQPYLDYVLGPDDPFDDESWSREFEEAADAVYGPLFAHRSET